MQVQHVLHLLLCIYQDNIQLCKLNGIIYFDML
jgi:hypothetical protein